MHRSHNYPRRKYSAPVTAPRLTPAADASLKRVFAAIGVPESRPFIPDRFQAEALEAVAHSDCLVTAPTGSGKTWIAEQAIGRIRGQGGRAWYACPLKALSNAKYADFIRIYGPDQVGILTGDRKENPDAPVVVGTTEILRNQFYDAMHHGESLGFVRGLPSGSVNLIFADGPSYKVRGDAWDRQWKTPAAFLLDKL